MKRILFLTLVVASCGMLSGTLRAEKRSENRHPSVSEATRVSEATVESVGYGCEPAA